MKKSNQIFRVIAILFFVDLVLLLATGCESSHPIQAADNSTESQLRIKPLPSMRDILDVPVDDLLVGIYRCDFETSNLTSVRLKLVAIRDHQSFELGQVTAPTLEDLASGTFYVAFEAHGGDEGTISRMLSLGISSSSSRRYEPIKGFTIQAPFAFRLSSLPLRDFTVSEKEDAVIWGICYSKRQKNESNKTVQELLADKGPFVSKESEKVIEAAKAMDDAIVVISIASGTK